MKETSPERRNFMNQPLHPKRWAILQIINMGTLISTLDVGIVNVTLPTMAEQYSVTLAQIQWVATAYLLTMVALLPFLGKISDKWDRRNIYSYGFLVFSLGSLCIAVSDGLVSLLISRCLQGIGATMIMANSQAMVRQLFPDHERGRALGMNAVVIAVGTMGGPAVGGLLLEVVSWPWLFGINVPIGIIAFVFGLRWFPQTKSNGRRGSFDFIGSILLACSASLLMLAAEGSMAEGLTNMIVVEAVIGIILLVILFIYERQIPDGILDRELFGNRNILLGNTGSFLINLAQAATLIPITFYLQIQLGLSAWMTGVLLIAQPLCMGFIAPFAGRFRDKYGAYFPITAGALLAAFSMLFVALSSQVSAVGIGLQLALFGAGMGLFHATNNAEIMSAAPDAKLSLTSSLLAMVRYLGQIAGIGIAIILVGNLGVEGENSSAVGVSMRILFGLCFVCCLVVAATARLLPRHKPAPQHP
jgi:EmrB/QacA subfamily drug resistance transporter